MTPAASSSYSLLPLANQPPVCYLLTRGTEGSLRHFRQRREFKCAACENGNAQSGTLPAKTAYVSRA